MTAERQLNLHPEARAELINAIRVYEQQRGGRGATFNDAVNHTISKIMEAPQHWPLARFVPPEVSAHSHLVKRFPYTVIYRLHGDHVLEVIAFAHQSRRPGYWLGR